MGKAKVNSYKWCLCIYIANGLQSLTVNKFLSLNPFPTVKTKLSKKNITDRSPIGKACWTHQKPGPLTINLPTVHHWQLTVGLWLIDSPLANGGISDQEWPTGTCRRARLWSLPMVESNMPDSLKVVGHSYDSSSVIGFTKRRKL
jgi:hypothetical protein